MDAIRQAYVEGVKRACYEAGVPVHVAAAMVKAAVRTTTPGVTVNPPELSKIPDFLGDAMNADLPHWGTVLGAGVGVGAGAGGLLGLTVSKEELARRRRSRLAQVLISALQGAGVGAGAGLGGVVGVELGKRLRQ